MKTFFLLLSFIPLNAFAQWTENFSDANFSNTPKWYGDTAKFIVNSSGQLQLNAPAEATSAYLSTSSKVCFKATWSFWIKMEFNPSSKNYANAYLMSDNADLSKPLNGYFLRIGGTNDDLCLFRQVGSTTTLIADGRDKMFNRDTVTARIKVTRDDQGNWAIYCDSTGKSNLSLLAKGVDNTITQSGYFGFQCIYSQTRSTKIYFDDIAVSGEPYNDGTKPFIESFKILDKNRLLITFSETVDSLSAANQNNYCLSDNTLLNVYHNTSQSTELTFLDSFQCEKDNVLQVKKITDIWGLQINDTTLTFGYCTPRLFDVVFNEIMADPTPIQGLPEAEYIELYNRSQKSLDLTGWKLFAGTKAYILPAFQLPADSFLMITSKDNQSKLAPFGATLGLFTSSSTLTNTGQFLKLEDSKGQLIAWTDYSDSWYADEFKAEGGWSLEQIDPWSPCGGEVNWKASKSATGGTPGHRNSVYNVNHEIKELKIDKIQLISDTIVDLFYNQPMDSTWTVNCDSYEISPDLGHPKKILINDKHFSSVRLYLAHPLILRQIYTLTIAGNIKDCAGNQFGHDMTLPLGMTEKAEKADLVINEVLFNAKTGGSDYVELYNRSNKFLNARQLLLGTNINDKPDNLVRLSEPGFLIYPFSYLLLTCDIDKVKAFYRIEDDKNFVELAQMPSLDDKAATIILMNDTFEIIDEFSYSEKMHLATLKDVNGVSLERISPEKPANFTGNWHSAAETAGYGTPGYKNSQAVDNIETAKAISLADEFFSPDNDGYRDFLQISYQFEQPGCRAQVYIFDATGRLVRHLLNNELLGMHGSFMWDGVNDEGRMCMVGMYVIFIRTVFDDGTVKEYKKPCVLAVKK